MQNNLEMEADKEVEDINVEIDNELILSLCWDAGMIAASYYNLVTMELMVTKSFEQKYFSLIFYSRGYE